MAEEIVRCRIRNDKLLKYIQESISNVRAKYLSDFKGKLLTLKNSKEEMEACIRLEQIERYELVPLLKSLCAHLARRTSYSTLDKRLLCALANPYSSQAEAAKPLLDRLINDGTIFPSEPAKRGDIHVYRSVYINSFSNIVTEVERSVAVSPAERNPVI